MLLPNARVVLVLVLDPNALVLPKPVEELPALPKIPPLVDVFEAPNGDVPVLVDEAPTPPKGELVVVELDPNPPNPVEDPPNI